MPRCNSSDHGTNQRNPNLTSALRMRMIKSIRLQNFRQFSDTTFDVGPFNLLVGPNNCGKTTLLHAIRAFFLLMHGHVRFEGNSSKASYHRRYLAGAEEVAPTPD